MRPICDEIISEPIFLSKFPGLPDHQKIKMELVVDITGFGIKIWPEKGKTDFSNSVIKHRATIAQSILNGTLAYDTEFHTTQNIFNKFIKEYNGYISSINRQDGFELAAELKKQQTPTVTPPHSQTGGATYQMPPGTQIFYTENGPTPDPIPCSTENTLTELTPPITVNVTINCHTSPSQSDLDCLTNQIKTILNDAFKKSSS